MLRTESLFYNHGQKSWDTFALLGCFPIHTGPTPPLTPQTILDACIQNFFPSFNYLQCVEGRTARKFRKGCTVLRGNREMTGKYEYCSTVPRTFVQDCRNCNTTLDGTSQFSGVKAGYSCRSTEPRQAHKEELREIISSRCYKKHLSLVSETEKKNNKTNKQKKKPEPRLVIQLTYLQPRPNVVETYLPIAAVIFVHEQRDKVQNHFSVMVSRRIPVYGQIKWIVIFCS